MSILLKEIQKRKTFGIISHPDAGKTTLLINLKLIKNEAIIHTY